jgi:hypothetical protein
MEETREDAANRRPGRAAALLGWLRRRIVAAPGLVLAAYASVLILCSTAGTLSRQFDQTGDLPYHLAAESAVAQAFSEGKNPLGPLELNFGTPILENYQPLLYLGNGLFGAVTGIDMLLVHNAAIVLLFLLTPFAARLAYRAIGLPDLAAGLAAAIALLSVAGFGNSFESIFSTAVINQLVGAVFLPLFIAVFARLLREGIYPMRAAALFALTFLAHVMMAVYAVFVGGLMFVTDKWDLRRIWKPLALFCGLGALLVAFWVVPFVSQQLRHRPIPDLVALPTAGYLQTALSPGQATRLLISGRLLDDPREPDVAARTGDDAVSDRMNMASNPGTRLPIVTVLALAGLLLSLLRLRVFAYRLLVAGFAFSFLLLMGPDDVGWINYLPFAGRIQFFRCTYLLEFFAFGLAGAGLEMIAAFVYRRAVKLGRRIRIAVACAGAATAIAGFWLHVVLVGHLANLNVNPLPVDDFEHAATVAAPAQAGFPLRTLIKSDDRQRDKRNGAYLGYRGISYVCGHWRIVGPLIARDLCYLLAEPGRSMAVSRRTGIGYTLVDRKRATALQALEHPKGKTVMRQVKRDAGYYLYQDTGAAFAWDASPAVLTVANDAQWLFLSRSWLAKLGRAAAGSPPTPVLRPRGLELTPRLLDSFRAVWILDPSQLTAADYSALNEFAGGGGPVFSVARIPELDTEKVFPAKRGVLATVADRAGEADSRARLVSAQVAGPYVLEVDAAKPTVVVVPTFAVDGWEAEVDGEPAPVLPAGASFVAVPVPVGKSRVAIVWRTPRAAAGLLAVSGVAWASILFAGVWIVVRKRRKRG